MRSELLGERRRERGERREGITCCESASPHSLLPATPPILENTMLNLFTSYSHDGTRPSTQRWLASEDETVARFLSSLDGLSVFDENGDDPFDRYVKTSVSIYLLWTLLSLFSHLTPEGNSSANLLSLCDSTRPLAAHRTNRRRLQEAPRTYEGRLLRLPSLAAESRSSFVGRWVG